MLHRWLWRWREGPWTGGYRWPPEARRGKGTDFSPRVSRRSTQPCRNPDFSLVRPTSDSQPPEPWDHKFALLSDNKLRVICYSSEKKHTHQLSSEFQFVFSSVNCPHHVVFVNNTAHTMWLLWRQDNVKQVRCTVCSLAHGMCSINGYCYYYYCLVQSLQVL